MKEKIKLIVITVLATLGVLFVVVMLLPDDKGDTSVAENTQVEVIEEEVEETDNKSENKTQLDEGSVLKEDDGDSEDSEDEEASLENESEGTGNTVKVDIPDSEHSDTAINFSTVTLDGQEVTEDIFSDYDITIVHLWGTFCGPCIREMPEYGKYCKEMPDNINLVGIVVDVYDGTDSNVKEAEDILAEADADFLNLRTSEDLYDIAVQFQYVPSSFFVDREGHLIGEALDGAGFDDTMQVLNGYIR